MLGEQGFRSPVRRELGLVGDFQPVLVHADLDGDVGRVVGVDERVVEGLAHSLAREGIALHADNALVGDGGAQILGVDEVYHTLGLHDERAVHLVLVQDVGIVGEEAYLDPRSGEPALRGAVEEQDGGALEPAVVVHQVEPLKQLGAGQRGILRGDAAVAQGKCAEGAEALLVQIGEVHAVQGDILPAETRLAGQEGIERVPGEQLAGAAAAVVVPAVAADGAGCGRDRDFQVGDAVFLAGVDIHHNAELAEHLVGQVLRELLACLLRDADHAARVVDADEQGTALRIGEGANLLEAIVLPRFLPFDTLVLGGLHGELHVLVGDIASALGAGEVHLGGLCVGGGAGGIQGGTVFIKGGCRDTGRKRHIHGDRQPFGRTEHESQSRAAADIRDLMAVHDDGGGSVGQSRAGESRRGQHAAFDMDVAVDEAGTKDFSGFSRFDLEFREMMKYPPFSRMIAVFFRGVDDAAVEAAARDFAAALTPYLHENVTVAGPVRAPIERIRGKFRYLLTLRGDHLANVRRALRVLALHRTHPDKVEISVDVDPQNLM